MLPGDKVIFLGSSANAQVLRVSNDVVRFSGLWWDWRGNVQSEEHRIHKPIGTCVLAAAYENPDGFMEKIEWDIKEVVMGWGESCEKTYMVHSVGEG